jgi:hypothetical protein
MATNNSLNTGVTPLTLHDGGTNAALTASNGGIHYSTSTATAILSGTATAQQLLLSGASTAPVWSTSTYPTTNAVSTLLYASSANVMAALATVNSAGLLTNSSGVPAWVAVTGTGAPVLANAPTFVTGTVTMPSVTFSSTSGVIGTTTNDSPATGSVGEIITGTILFASAVSISSGDTTSKLSISLTAGDWDVWGAASYAGAASTTVTGAYAGLGTVNSTTPPDRSVFAGQTYTAWTAFAASTSLTVNAPPITVKVANAGTQTVWLIPALTFAVSTATFCGSIIARRRR